MDAITRHFKKPPQEKTFFTGYFQYRLLFAYQPAYSYYLYAKEMGYSPVNLTRGSLLSKFDKPNQKLVKKLLRKNGIILTDEISFVSAWNLIFRFGIEINVKNRTNTSN
ncbi:MAG: hypothetical protein NTV30_00045 [Chloroflexi bacterium]|nr:hypothetical protein [Chloroflexota bacterium]